MPPKKLAFCKPDKNCAIGESLSSIINGSKCRPLPLSSKDKSGIRLRLGDMIKETSYTLTTQFVRKASCVHDVVEWKNLTHLMSIINPIDSTLTKVACKAWLLIICYTYITNTSAMKYWYKYDTCYTSYCMSKSSDFLSAGLSILDLTTKNAARIRDLPPQA